MGGKTRNIAVQFVLPQCCKTSCMFYRTLTEILSIDCTHLWRIDNIIHKYDHFQQSKILRRTKKSILQSDGVQVIISNWNWCRLNRLTLYVKTWIQYSCCASDGITVQSSWLVGCSFSKRRSSRYCHCIWLSYNLQLLLILILSPCSSVFYFLGKTWRVWYVSSLQPENWLHIFVEIAQLPGADLFGESHW